MLRSIVKEGRRIGNTSQERSVYCFPAVYLCDCKLRPLLNKTNLMWFDEDIAKTRRPPDMIKLLFIFNGRSLTKS